MPLDGQRGRRGAKAIPTRTCAPTIGPAPRASRASRHTPHSDDRLSPLRGEKPDSVVAQHEARRAHRSRREKVSGGRRSAQVVCSSVPHSHVTARALVRLARSMGFQGQIRPSHSVREPGRRCHDAQRRRTRAPAVPTIFTRCVGLVCTSATSGTRILVMASQRRGSCRLAPAQGSRGSEKETVKVYIL